MTAGNDMGSGFRYPPAIVFFAYFHHEIRRMLSHEVDGWSTEYYEPAFGVGETERSREHGTRELLDSFEALVRGHNPRYPDVPHL